MKRGSVDEQWRFIASSKARKHVLDLAARVSAAHCPILIIGPTGVGKEVLAEDIHTHSPRAAGRFVALNCAALTPTLFESELFGHQRGAYTGAVAQKLGLVELADKGTLFLDEVGELPVEIQAKLLRFLARGTFWPLGGTDERRADVRVIAATNRDLRAMMPSSFREDLFYRLSVMPIVAPPRDADDTQAICTALADEIARQRGIQTGSREITILAKLAAQSRWPGGVRELRNTLERYFVLRDPASSVKQNWQTSLDLGAVQILHSSLPAPTGSLDGDAAEMLKVVENLIFLELARGAGGVRDLAQRLALTPQAVYDRLKKLGLNPKELQGDKLVALLLEARHALAPYQPWIQALLNS